MELRRLLESTATASNFPRSRFGRRAVGVSIAAFAVAGALTGGALVGASPVWNADHVDSARFMATGIVGTHGTLLGDPIEHLGSESTVLDMGAAPKAATGVVVAIDCVDPGPVVASVDADSDRPQSLSDGYCDGTSGQEVLISSEGAHSISLTVKHGKAFAVFASWIKESPAPGPSAAQEQAMADGRVTRTEYIASYNRFAGCMTAAGFPLPSAPDGVVYYPYATTEEANIAGADARCYESEFRQVDSAWQLSVRATIDACLVARGAAPVTEPSGGLVDLIEQLLPLHLTFDECRAEQGERQ